MISLSSLKPIGTNSEYDNNQFNSWQSWQTAFSQIVYFNEPQPILQSANTLYINSEAYPPLWQFAELAAYQSDWCAITNGDIIIGENWPRALNSMRVKKTRCFTSWRYEFNPAIGLNPARVVDAGIDIFGAHPEVWRKIVQVIPENIRLGCQKWDWWMLGAFAEFGDKWFHGITNYRCVFHPKHGNRQYGGDVGDVALLNHGRWPDEI